MKTAIVGMGNMGSNYAVMISQGQVPDVTLSAVTRIRPEKYEQIKSSLSVDLKIYDSDDALFLAFDAGEVFFDAVIITTPHYSHEQIALKAFCRGISVLCDKPAGVYSRQARNMQSAFEEAKKKFPALKYGVIFQQRTNEAFLKIKEIAESNVYGNIRRVKWTVTDWFRPNAYFKTGSWKATWAGDGGGVILNQCPHNLDILQWICGMPSKVQAFCYEGKYHDIEVEDDVTAFFEWEKGATGTFITSTGDAAGMNRLEITFEDALLICENGGLKVFELEQKGSEHICKTTDFFTPPKGVWKELPVTENGNGYAKLISAFTGGNLVADGVDGIKNLLMSNAIYLSSWENRSIELPQMGSPEEKLFEEKFEAALERKKK